jgi:hypothetical protein
MRERIVVSGLSACLIASCGGAGTDAGESTSLTGVTASNGDETASSGNGDGDGDGDSNSGPNTNTNTNGDGDGAPGDGDGDPGDGDADEGDDGFKFDIHGIPDGEIDCQCGTTLDFSYIWIANSTQSTVTKLNTETM